MSRKSYPKRNAAYIALINSPRWVTLRNRYLARQPLCELCKSQGLYTSATEVHHRQPIEQGRSQAEMQRLAYDPNNLQALCHSCHVGVHKAMKSHSKAAMAENAARTVERFKARFFGGD